MNWEIVIGLETHAQLSTASKMFSGASTAFGAPPNTQASAVDIALPGVLPVANKGAVERAIRFGLAVGGEKMINRRSVFARKNYFYPDLPKGYQISQYELPIVQGGEISIVTKQGEKKIRLTRAHVGRNKIVKIEGSYHGHHDTVLMSTKPSVEAAGPADRPHTVPASKGIPTDIKQNTIIAPYNDPEALDRILTEHEGEVAGVITEAVLMNVGIILPDDGYLQSVREITHRHGVLLIFDEVKTGVTVAPGGITEIYPVKPDLICLAKSIGGGMPIGAFGGRAEIMRRINHSEVLHLGTFNGNPMSMRSGLVTLTQIFTPEAHAHANSLSKQLGESYIGIIEEFDLPMHVAQIGAKGCAMFRFERARNYRAWWDIDMDVSYAYWLFLANRGILFPPGFDDQWTVSIQHTQEDIDHHTHVFHQFVTELTR